MKNLAIRRMYSYFETTTEEIDEGSFESEMEKLDEELGGVLEKYGLRLIKHDMRFVPMQKMSATKCSRCDNLMINRDENLACPGSSDHSFLENGAVRHVG